MCSRIAEPRLFEAVELAYSGGVKREKELKGKPRLRVGERFLGFVAGRPLARRPADRPGFQRPGATR
jgi:hypothetical protein